MSKLGIGLFLVALVLASTFAAAQTTTRVRGIITAVDGKLLLVKSRDGKDVRIELSEKTILVATRPLTLADIKPGDAVGLGAARRADGTLVALQVQRFPAERGIPNEGHRPWDLPDSTMTNAAVTAMVDAADGRELTLTYKGGSQKILVPQGAAIFTSVPADRSSLVPGESVFLTAQVGGDGTITAQRILVSKDGIKLPQ